MAKGRPLSCESQGVLRVAACGPSFMVVLRAPSVSACSRCWMLMDGVWWWCSTWCCLIFLLNGVWQGERKSAEKDALLSLGLLWLTLACAKLVCFCGGCACYLSFRFVLGKERGNSSEKVAKARRKTACIRADTEKMPQKMTATCHTRPQASLHKYKAAGINERQQEHKEPGAKILMNIEARTAGWRSSLSNGAGWISSLSNGAHWRKPNKRRRGRVPKPLFNNHSITAKESWHYHYPMCSFNFCWGCVGDALERRMPYEMLVPRCKGILQRVNCHFIRALCAPSVSPCGSCGTVMDGHGHLHTVIAKEFCWRAFARSMLMSHSPMGHHKLVCFCLPCALCFLSLCTLKS